MRTPTSRIPNSVAVLTRAGRGDSAVASGNAGFSLIEVLAVLVIAALALGTVTLGFGRRTDQMGISALAASAANRARTTRDLAIRTGQDTMLLIDLEARTISGSGAARPLSIPPDIDLEVVSSSAERRQGTVAGVRFFPDGMSTGATIRLGQSRSAHEVRINWFTGRVQVVPPS